MVDDIKVIRTILAPVSDGQLMLPGSVVAEVIGYTEPNPIPRAPDWLLGEIGWHDWNVPVVSFAVLCGLANGEAVSRQSKIVVVKSLSASSITPYIGILISGLPRLAKIGAESLSDVPQINDLPCVFREVMFDEQQAMIPDLDAMVEIIQAAVQATAS